MIGFDSLREWYRGDATARFGLAIGCSALVMFLVTAEVVLSGNVQSLDEQLLLLLHPSDAGWLTEATRDLTALGGYVVLTLIVVATSVYLRTEGRPWASRFFVCVVVSGFVVNMSLKAAFDRPRPDVVNHLSYVDSSSFPSGHSMMSTIVYLTAGAVIAHRATNRLRRGFLIFGPIVLTGLVGCSRVQVGVHYPTDVLAGWSAGVMWTVICCLSVQFYRYRSTERQTAPRNVVETHRTAALDRSRCDV